MSILILGISTIIQFVAAILSVRLIKVTGTKGAWIFIAIAMTLMGIRRSLTLYRSVSNDAPYSADLTAELVALTISILMILGVMLIGPIFRKYQSINETLHLSEKKYRDMVNLLPQPIYEANMQGNVTFANHAGYISFDTNFDDIYGKTHILDFIIPEDRERAKKNIQSITQGEAEGPTEYTMLRKNGSTFPALVYSIPIINKEKVSGIRGLIIDLTERRQAEENIARFNRIFEDSLNEIYLFDGNTLKFVQLNNAALHNLGYTLEEMRELTPVDLTPEFTLELFEKILVPLRKGDEKIVVLETAHQRKDGSLYDAELHLQVLIQHNTQLFSAFVLDITKRKQSDRNLSYQASHDALTGLINRQEFKSRLERVRETAEKDDSFNILCYIDLDQFKVINDTCGHVAGDELLRQITGVMASCVRQCDTLGRLGGDEFGLLIERCNFDQAQRIAEKMINTVREYNFAWNEGVFNVGISVGMVGIGRGSDNADELMKAADTACYTAKEKGRNRLEIFKETDEKLARRDGETQWAIRIPRALSENRFCLYQQEIMDISGNNEGLHYEILLRMIGEDGSIIMPASFFPAAERYKLATDIDIWVVTNVFGWLHDNPEHLRRLRTCAINLSALSVSNDTFQSFVVEQLQAYDIPPEKICFEITETVAISNLSSAIIFISVLKKLGCQFALDDFGSGLSSYAYLKNLPVDVLKIDGVFVKDILEDKMDLATVKSINEIGHVMGHKTIAEFVENKEILEKLREIGVDFAQGYGISIPMPLSVLASK